MNDTHRTGTTSFGLPLSGYAWWWLWLSSGFALMTWLADGVVGDAGGRALPWHMGYAALVGLAAARGASYGLVERAGPGERFRYGAFSAAWSAPLVFVLLGMPDDERLSAASALAGLAFGGAAALTLRPIPAEHDLGPQWAAEDTHGMGLLWGALIGCAAFIVLGILLGGVPGADGRRSLVMATALMVLIIPYRTPGRAEWPFVWAMALMLVLDVVLLRAGPGAAG